MRRVRDARHVHLKLQVAASDETREQQGQYSSFVHPPSFPLSQGHPAIARTPYGGRDPMSVLHVS